MKKFFAALLAVMLVFSLCVTASAANADLSGNSFKAYQIFSGDEADGVLSNIEWGSGVDGAALLTALKGSAAFGTTNPFANCKDADDVATVMATWTNGDANCKAFAKLAYANKAGNGTAVTADTELAAGYYVIADVSTFEEGTTGTVKNLNLLQLTSAGKVEIKSKVDIPTVQKKVKDVNDSVATADWQDHASWQDSADYDFGDYVPFQLKATLGNIDDYDTYKVVFHDTQDAGFGAPVLTKTGDIEGLKVYIGDSETGLDVTQQFHAALVDGGNDFTVSCDNVKAAAVGAESGSVITVEYYAQLLNTAAVGAAGNWNAVYLEYSNDAEHSGEGNNNTGNTPEDKVVVFTYSVVVTKKDGQDNSKTLKGAGFSLYKYNESSSEKDKYELVKTFAAASDVDTFTWSGIDDGNYKLVEDTAPAGYNKMDDLYFSIIANHQTQAVEPTLVELTAPGLVADTESGAVNFAQNSSIAADVLNFKGTVLPETGGRGTTIFYAVGGVMVVAAVVLLLTKKRMKAEA